MPGRPRSSTTMSGGSLATSCRAAAPSWTTVTPRPGVSRNSAVKMRPCIGSSSTDSSRRRGLGRGQRGDCRGLVPRSAGPRCPLCAGFVPSIAIPLHRPRDSSTLHHGPAPGDWRGTYPRGAAVGPGRSHAAVAAAAGRRMIEARQPAPCAICRDGAILERHQEETMTSLMARDREEAKKKGLFALGSPGGRPFAHAGLSHPRHRRRGRGRVPGVQVVHVPRQARHAVQAGREPGATRFTGHERAGAPIKVQEQPRGGPARPVGGPPVCARRRPDGQREVNRHRPRPESR